MFSTCNQQKLDHWHLIDIVSPVQSKMRHPIQQAVREGEKEMSVFFKRIFFGTVTEKDINFLSLTIVVASLYSFMRR